LLEEVSATLQEPALVKLASNYITSELKTPVAALEVVEVVRMINAGELSSKGAKEVFKQLQAGEGSARTIAEKSNLMQNSNESELKKIAEEVLSEEKKGVPTQYLVGQAMKKSGGRA